MSQNTRAVLFMPNWLGDALFATPAVRALKKSVPGLTLACVAATRVAPVLLNNPYVDELFVYDEEPLMGSARSMGLTSELKKHKFDSAVFFHNSRTKSVIARLAGVADRIGPVSSKKTFLTRTVEMPDKLMHRIDYYLKLVEPLGAKPHGRTMDFYPRAEAAGRLRAILAAKGVGESEPYAVVHAGGNWELKRWPIAYFKEWSRLIATRFPWKIVVCGTGDEKKLAAELCITDPKRIVSVCGETSLDELALLLRGAKLLLSNDSGPIHVAATQETPVIGLFGPTDTAVTGPVSSGALKTLRVDAGCGIPCYFSSCDYRVCMDWLTPQTVFAETEKLLAGAA